MNHYRGVSRSRRLLNVVCDDDCTSLLIGAGHGGGSLSGWRRRIRRATTTSRAVTGRAKSAPHRIFTGFSPLLGYSLVASVLHRTPLVSGNFAFRDCQASWRGKSTRIAVSAGADGDAVGKRGIIRLGFQTVDSQRVPVCQIALDLREQRFRVYL